MQTAPPPDETKPVRSSRPEQVSAAAANGAPAERDGFKKTKVGWVPEDWGATRLRDLIRDISAGYSANSEDRQIQNGELGVLKVSAVSYGNFRPEEHKAVLSKERDQTKRPPSAGTIIISRSNTAELVGASVFVQNDYPNLRLPDTLWEIKTEDDVSAEWLNFALASERMRAGIQSAATGTSGSMKKLSMKRLRGLRIAVPPLPEQRRIAAVLAAWDRALAQTGALLNAKQRRKKALMQQLLTGKTRLPEFAHRKPVRSSRPEQVSSPEAWQEVKLQDFATRQRSRREATEEKSCKCIELKHIVQDYGFTRGYTCFDEKSSKKYAFSKGQVLFGRLRPYLRKYWQATFDGVCSTEIWVMEGKESRCLDNYLFYLVQSERFYQAANVTSGTRMPRASWGFLSETHFDLPPLPEQRAIASILDTCDDEIAMLRAERDALQRQKKGMMQKLLTGRVRVPAGPEPSSPTHA